MLVFRQISKIFFWLLLIVAVVSLISTYFSLWFAWNLLPASGSVAFAIDYTQPYAHALESYLAALPAARYLAYSNNAQGQTMVLMPSLLHYVQTKGELENQGWTVDRLGVILRAHKNEADSQVYSLENPSLAQAFIHTFTQLITHPETAFPIAMVQIKQGGIPQADDDYSLIAFARRGMITGSVQKGISDPLLLGVPAILSKDNLSNLSMSLPSDILTLMPSSLLNQIEPKIWSSFNFLKTQPLIISELKRHSAINIKFTNDASIIGVIGQPESFITQVSNWLSQEDAYYRPVKQAFRLPDGDLGYEVIPGKIKSVLSSLDGDGCRESSGQGVKVWLCSDNSKAVLSTNKEAALAAVKESQSSLYIAMNETIMKVLNLPDLDLVTIQGKDSQVVFNFDFKK